MTVTHWNYRVLAHEYQDNDDQPQTDYQIAEVFYEDDLPKSWSVALEVPHGDTLLDLMSAVRALSRAWSKPILWMLNGRLVSAEEYKAYKRHPGNQQ